MPAYRYTGAYPRALFGLSHGVNATITHADGHETPVGATVEAHPGDTVTTAEAYDHADLAEITLEDALADVEAAAELGAEAVKELKRAAKKATQEAATATDEETRMTAEGAPAPETEQEN